MLTYLNALICHYPRIEILSLTEEACYLVCPNSKIVARHRNRNKLRARLRAFRTFKHFARKDSRIMKYTHEVLANFHGHATDSQPHTNQSYTTKRQKNANDAPAAPATPPKGGKAAKIPPRKQNSNFYHNLNDLISSDCVHDVHGDSHTTHTNTVSSHQVPKITNTSYLAPNTSLTAAHISELKENGLSSPEIRRIRTHSNHLKGNKEHFYIPKTECSYCQYNPQVCRYCGFIFQTFSDRNDGHKRRNEHDCHYEAYKEGHMKDYERPVGIKPVISTIPYRNTDAPQPPSKMDMLRNQAQQIAKQTSEKKQNAWTQRQNDTASSVPKKRVNVDDLFNLAKKQK